MYFQQLEIGDSQLRYYPDAPLWDGQPCAAIGALKFAQMGEAAHLIEQACIRAQSEARHALFAPMDGDTWHSYRLWLESDGTPPFLLEPTSRAVDADALLAAGFEVVSRYYSTRAPLAQTLAARPVEVEGVKISHWNGQNGADLVDQIFALSKASFAQNRFFKPIDLQGFHEIYDPMLAAIDPQFVLLAHSEDGAFIGFLFGYPDLLSAGQKTIVLKTYASNKRGVGFALADHFHRHAQACGFETVIHALMHEENQSFSRSKMHNAVVFRRYGLLAKILDDGL